MKKTYIMPEMVSVEIETNTSLLAGSPLLGGEFGGGTVLGHELVDDAFTFTEESFNISEEKFFISEENEFNF